MTPTDQAWALYNAHGLRTDNPIGLMHAVLDAYAREVEMKAAVRAYVQAEPDSKERILAFAALVRAVEAP